MKPVLFLAFEKTTVCPFVSEGRRRSDVLTTCV